MFIGCRFGRFIMILYYFSRSYDFGIFIFRSLNLWISNVRFSLIVWICSPALTDTTSLANMYITLTSDISQSFSKDSPTNGPQCRVCNVYRLTNSVQTQFLLFAFNVTNSINNILHAPQIQVYEITLTCYFCNARDIDGGFEMFARQIFSCKRYVWYIKAVDAASWNISRPLG